MLDAAPEGGLFSGAMGHCQAGLLQLASIDASIHPSLEIPSLPGLICIVYIMRNMSNKWQIADKNKSETGRKLKKWLGKLAHWLMPRASGQNILGYAPGAAAIRVVRCPDCGNDIVADDDDACVCIQCGGRNRRRLGLTEQERYIREPDSDKRIGRGDDFAGDAWRDRQTNEIRYVAVGHNPNA